MAVTRLRFVITFPLERQLLPLFGIKVFRVGSNPKMHDEELVSELNRHKLNSGFSYHPVTQALAGQDCFFGGLLALPPDCNQNQLAINLSRLNDMTIEEVASLWIKADCNIYTLIKNLGGIQLSNRMTI